MLTRKREHTDTKFVETGHEPAESKE